MILEIESCKEVLFGDSSSLCIWSIYVQGDATSEKEAIFYRSTEVVAGMTVLGSTAGTTFAIIWSKKLVYTHDSRNTFYEKRREPTSNDLGNRLDDTDAHDDESKNDTCISWYLLPS